MIIATNINQLSMSSTFDVLTTEKGSVELYLKELMSQPINSKDVYVDFTQICYLYDKKAINYLNLDETKELINIAKEVDNITIPLVKTIRGRKGKTFIHYALLLDALRWISKRIAYEIDKVLRQIFRQADIIKTERNETITEFHPLTKILKDKFVPCVAPDKERFVYKSVFDFANLQVIGTSSSAYKTKHNLGKKDSIRCHFNSKTLDKVIAIEKEFYNIIKYSDIDNYQALKALYLKRVNIKYIHIIDYDELKQLNIKLDRLEKRKQTDKTVAKIKELKSLYN